MRRSFDRPRLTCGFTQARGQALTRESHPYTQRAVRSIRLSAKEDNKVRQAKARESRVMRAVLRTGNRSGAKGSERSADPLPTAALSAARTSGVVSLNSKHIAVAALLIGCALPASVQAREVEPSVYNLVTSMAQAHGVDPALAHAVVAVESGYNCAARNPHSSASGPMQVLKSTARAVGVGGNLRDCRTGLEAGMRYLSRMVTLSGGSACAAASAFNRGAVGGCSAYGRKVVASMRRPTHVAGL